MSNYIPYYMTFDLCEFGSNEHLHLYKVIYKGITIKSNDVNLFKHNKLLKDMISTIFYGLSNEVEVVVHSHFADSRDLSKALKQRLSDGVVVHSHGGVIGDCIGGLGIYVDISENMHLIIIKKGFLIYGDNICRDGHNFTCNYEVLSHVIKEKYLIEKGLDVGV